MGQQDSAERERIAELECKRDRLDTELEEARQDLSILAYVVSHDLTAPLRAIDGYSTVVREAYGPSWTRPAGSTWIICGTRPGAWL